MRVCEVSGSVNPEITFPEAQSESQAQFLAFTRLLPVPGAEEEERCRRPQEADERLHDVAQRQPRENQVGEPWNLHHRDIQEGRGNVEAAGQR